jgi:hypothetical protein
MALVLVSLPALAAAQWADSFDSYANGSGLHGQGGWRGWNGSVAADAFVSGVQARSVPHSVAISPTSDIVQQFVGVNSGRWTISGWCFVPTGSTGEQYFILLNDYTENGVQNWSTQILINSTTGLVTDFDAVGPSLPIIRNQWVEVRVEIDFTVNSQTIYYGGTFLNTKSWTEGASGMGDLNLEALDLFSNLGSTIYWDDLSLIPENPVSIEPSSWGQIKSIFR